MERSEAASFSHMQLPRVATGSNVGFTPSIQPDVSHSPSSSKILVGTGSSADGSHGAEHGVTSSHPLVIPSPPAPELPRKEGALDVMISVTPNVPKNVDRNVSGSSAEVPSPDDASMELSPSPTAAPLPSSDSRPTLADVIMRQETVRRDAAQADAIRRRVETPKPLACDIEAIERQYATGGDWSFIASYMDQARPYALPRAKFDMIIDTGRTLAKTPLMKIMASLSGKSHGNEHLEELYKQFEIGQISKLPGGNLRLKVKSRDACLRLERTKVNILGGVYTFKEFDILGGRYFIDISNVDSDTETDVILHRLFLIGCKPVYDTFREVNLATGITSATWRVYFLSSSCPSALMVNGSVCDQVCFNNKLHPAHGKNAPFQSERLPYGYRSHHGIDLGAPADVFPPPNVVPKTGLPKTGQPQRPQSTSKAQAADAAAQLKEASSSTSLQRAVEQIKQKEGQLQRGAQHGQQLVVSDSTTPLNTTEALSISTYSGSNGRITPPSSPKNVKKPLVLTNGPDDGFTTVSNKKKRARNGFDFSNMTVKEETLPLNGIATTNYFQALQTMEVTFTPKNVTADKKYGVRYQVVPIDVKRPDVVKTSSESAFFIEKHHTKIKKASKASSIMEVTESMVNDENTALLNTLPDCLVRADKKVDGVCKLLENVTNPDHIMKKAVECPLAFSSAVSLKMADTGDVIAEIAQLHVINRVLCASQPTEDITFSTKWARFMGMAVPSKRKDIFKICAKWWTSSDSIRELSRATKALGIFEIALMSIAPTLFINDHWIQYITGQPVDWIPAHHTRLLHPNTLLRLLRSDLGSFCIQQWSEVQWQGYLLDDLEELRKLDGFYLEDSSVLQLQFLNGEVVMVAGGLTRHY